jgi:hypothetical protein
MVNVIREQLAIAKNSESLVLFNPSQAPPKLLCSVRHKAELFFTSQQSGSAW